MNIILDNIVFFLQKSGGGSVYWNELIKRISVNKRLRVTYIEPNSLTQNFLYNQHDFQDKNTIKEFPCPLVLSLLPFMRFLSEKTIFHSSYYRISLSRNAVNVLTIHDFTPEKFFKGYSKAIQIWRKQLAIRYSDVIICISQNTKEDLKRFYGDIKKPIYVIYNGVSEDYYPLNDLDLENSEVKKKLGNSKFILYIGHRTSYKNFYFALDVIARLENYKLVVVGNAFSSAEVLEIEKKANGKVILFSNISNSKLNEIFNLAHCFLYPSSYEGFGIPVIEAMKSGCVVVALNSSSIPEISNGAALLLENLNVDKFVSEILSLEDESHREIFIKRGIDNASRFSWDKCYEQVLKVYENAMETSNYE